MWGIKEEEEFFTTSLANGVPKESLFYSLFQGDYAYVPKGFSYSPKTLQSRNTYIGRYTEAYAKNLFTPIAKSLGLYALNSVVCKEIGLTQKSAADLALCTTNRLETEAKNIKLVAEIKMSIVSNYKWDGSLSYVGDYTTHKGEPSLLRSDSMLKAIGKSIGIRVSGEGSKVIPIIVIGNSPITKSYCDKVDHLKKRGVIQGFISLNPSPRDGDFLKESPLGGFKTMGNLEELRAYIVGILSGDLNYFSSMLPLDVLGDIIYKASNEVSPSLRAKKFLTLIEGEE